MEFKMDAGVYTADGDQVGEIDRVVLDPKTKEVTHIVVCKGLLFKEDKVISVDWVSSTATGRITLRPGVGDPESWTNFIEEEYIVVEQAEYTPAVAATRHPLPLYYYPTAVSEPMPAPYEERRTVKREEKTIPEEQVALQEGADVISADDEHVGDVEEVFTYPRTDRASQFLISAGLLLKERKLIPIHWVDRLTEEKVHLAVGSRLLDKLPAYEG
jgi:uncharacterized protein YrrD